MLHADLTQTDRDRRKINSNVFILFVKWNDVAPELSHSNCCISSQFVLNVDCRSTMNLNQVKCFHEYRMRVNKCILKACLDGMQNV
jgi:hypothetical protein